MEFIVSPRSLLALILALVSGGAAAVGVTSYIKNQSRGPNQEMANVVVAAVDIPRGMVVKEDQIKLQEIPKNLVHPHAITNLKDALERQVLTPLFKDEDVLDGKLARKGAKPGMSGVVKSGMRALTIQTPSLAAGVAGFVMPGDHVDVLLTVSGGGDNTGGSTATLLQNIEVMAVDQRIEPSDGTKLDINQLRSVTLQVTPDQSQLLTLAQNSGMLHLSLRSPEDDREAMTRTAIAADLPTRKAAPVKMVEAPTPNVVEPPTLKAVSAVKAVEPARYVHVYKAALQRVEKHRTDGGPYTIEAWESVENGTKVVNRLAAPQPGPFDEFDR
jgi:pilus assembly protein CpaB